MTVLNACVSFAVIPALKDNEGLVIYVDVGNLPNSKALEYVQQVRDEMMKSFSLDNGNRFFFCPMREGIPSVKFETISKDQE